MRTRRVSRQARGSEGRRGSEYISALQCPSPCLEGRRPYGICWTGLLWNHSFWESVGGLPSEPSFALGS